jgi:hypothetical protein
MKLILTLSAIPSALACLHVWGQTSISPLPDLSGIGRSGANDNGREVCNSDWGSRIDQDGHYSIGCIPGYYYAFSKGGDISYYGNGQNDFSFANNPSKNKYCCVGACDDRKGASLSCTDSDWDLKVFGC